MASFFKKRGSWFDGIIISFIVFLGTFLTLIFEFKPIVSMFFFFVLPSIYMLLRKKYYYQKIFGMSFLVGILSTFLDIVVNASKGWFVPDNQLFLKWRIFGYAPLEEAIWFFFFFLFVILFYEFFIEKDRIRKISKNSKYFLWLVVITTFFIIGLFLFGFIEKIGYVYLWSCLAYMFPPIVYLIYKNPLIIKKLVFLMIPIFIINLLHELTAIKVGQWIFPGQYIGKVVLFGLEFPFEEFLFYLVFGSITAVAYYEIFFDDMR